VAKFTDKAGREWTLDLDVPTCERIQKATDVRIGRLLADGLGTLMADPVLLVRVLWVMVEPDAIERKVSPESFGKAFNGDALEDAADAFYVALADFSPRQQRQALKALLARGKDLSERELAKTLAEIATFDPDRPKAPTPSTGATSAPPSSASTPVAAG
jgi:hypothetical protein